MSAELESLLKKCGQVTLDAAGHGVLTFDPDNANQRWEIDSIVVGTNQAATATTVPVATLAVNSTSIGTLSTGNQQGSTWNGNQDTFTGRWDLGPCDFISVLFAPPTGQAAGSSAGAIAYANVYGRKFTRRS